MICALICCLCCCLVSCAALFPPESPVPLLFSGASVASAAANNCVPEDLAALRSIAASFLTAANFSDWASSDDCCTSWGPLRVTCTSHVLGNGSSDNTSAPGHSSTTKKGTVLPRVTALAQDRLAGFRNIPPSVCRLSALTSLTIAYNFENTAESTIPPCIGTNLTNLVHLDLSHNFLTGPIPRSFSQLASLQSIDLSDNFLTGHLLPSLFPSRSLRSVHLGGNAFTGPFPSFFASHFPNLTNLDLYYMPIVGNLPAFQTPNLRELTLSGLRLLTGNLSSLLSGAPLLSLTHLDLSYNALSGSIPTLDLLPSLSLLDLSGNYWPGLDGSLRMSSILCALANLTVLRLSHNGLSGALSSEQCRQPMFTQLSALDLSHNQFSGPFPEWIGALPKLRHLDLSNNYFHGIIPRSWQNLSSTVRYLSLSVNSPLLAETPGAPKLPYWLFTSPQISYLDLSSLQLQSQDLDCSSTDEEHMLGNATSMMLSSLDLSHNDLTSGVLPCLSSFTRLSDLNLAGNPLALNLDDPDDVMLIPMVTGRLDVSSCNLTGHLTDAFFESLKPFITSLSLADNRLAGRIPAGLGNLTSLYSLDLSGNSFTGLAPGSMQKLSCFKLQLSKNLFQGDLTPFLSDINMSVLGSLDVSHNHLTGPISASLIGLETLKLDDNFLEGVIPGELFQYSDSHGMSDAITYPFTTLSVKNNNLSGELPSSLSNLKFLEILDLRSNRLEGNMNNIALFRNAAPNQFSYLRLLLLGYNRFTGSIPSVLAEVAPALQVIDFSNNRLSGAIPVHTLQRLSEFRNGSLPLVAYMFTTTLSEEVIINLKGGAQRYQSVRADIISLDLSGNNLSGPIPVGLGELNGLVSLNLSRNGLSGPIPADLGQLSGLENLDLSFNQLVGPIPASFRAMTKLEVFNVSFNPGLNGSVPLGQPQFENRESYMGDPSLCGEHILRACGTAAMDPSPHVETKQDSSRSYIGRWGEEMGREVGRWVDEWVSVPGLCLGIVVGFGVPFG